MMLRSERKLTREVSLYDPIGTDKEGNEISLLDIVENPEMDIADRIALKGSIHQLYDNLDRLLSSREKEIICRRYGLGGQPAATQKEIAEKLGISRSYVSRIEKRALEKLRCGMDSWK